jgi:AcrR family transcriptional regulator
MTASPRRPGRPLRRDAQRNRDAIVSAGRLAFAAGGVDASLETVARQAGVAIGTLYRHFPSRLHLVEAVFLEKAHAWVEAAQEALAIADPWDGFAYYLERLCELQADDRGFNDVACMRLAAACCLEDVKHEAVRLARRIVARAQRAGSLRADVTAEDIAFLVWGSTRITQATSAVAPRAWRRHLGLLLDGFRAENAHVLPEPPLRPQQVQAAMLALAEPARRLRLPAGPGPLRRGLANAGQEGPPDKLAGPPAGRS